MIINEATGKLKVIVFLLCLYSLMGCDPVQDIKLENQTNKSVELVVGPLDSYWVYENAAIGTVTMMANSMGK